MASREAAFDFLAVLQKNHGGKERYDRQSPFGSGGWRPEAQNCGEK
jgi:hypothetical protein